MSRRSGFTLIELLITIMIIGMLSSMLMFGLLKVQAQTQAARTKTTIAKIDELLRQRWQSFGTRRLPVSSVGVNQKAAAELRLVAIRQIQRMELPDHWSEVTAPLTILKKLDGSNAVDGNNNPITLPRTGLANAYQRYYDTVGVNKAGAVPANSASGKPSIEQQDAECLYMILTEGASDERNGREMFLESEIADVDGDGAPEFVDGWGMPIRFIRWPVGFIDDPRQDSSAQARFGHLSDLMPPKVSGTCKPDAANKHDAMDPLRVDTEAFLIYPLIYSGGPDKIGDISAGFENDQVRDDPYDMDLSNGGVRADSTPCGTYDPVATFSFGTPSIGVPKWPGIPHDFGIYRNQNLQSPNGKMNHYDNIHNHQQLNASLQ